MSGTKKTHKFIAIFVVALLLFSCAGCTINGKTNSSETALSTSSNEATAEVQGKAPSAQEIIAKMSRASEEYGFENALSELELQSETSINGDTYFRLQQNYQGIPVYGRSAVYVTDSSGEMVSASGNLFDIEETLDLSLSLSNEDIITACTDYFGEDDKIDNSTIESVIPEDALCVYNLFGHEPCLAYNSTVAVNGVLYQVLVSCPDAEVLLCSPCLILEDGETVIGSGKDVGGKTVSFNTYRKNSSDPFVLYDAQRNLIVYDAAGETVFTNYSFLANDGERYHTQTKVDALSNTEYTLVIKESDNTAVDASLLRFDPTTLAWHLSKKESGNGLEVPTSSSTNWTEKTQVTALNRTEIIFDFYQDVLHRSGFDGNGSRMHIVINNLGAKDGVAFSLTPFKHTTMTMISFYKEMSLDVMAHEYTHSVEAYESGMIYQNESGALMEALSDIFGELVEDYANDSLLNGNCDWKHGSRDIKNPKSNGYPDTYHGDNWGQTYTEEKEINAKGNDRGHVHNNSTVVSHAAYLMWNGIDGTDSKKLSAEQLAQLWYRAMLMMPSDCDFVTCRRMVELAAQSVNLTNDQIACVSEAFDEVGIYTAPADFDYTVGMGSNLTVLDKNGNPYADYVCHIDGTLSKRTELEDRSYAKTFLDNTTEPLSLPSQEGAFTVHLYDKTDAPQPISFTLKIDPTKAAQEIKLATSYQANPIIDVDNLVVDVYSADVPYRDAGGNLWSLEYHIPKINIESSEITALNQKLFDDLHPTIQQSISAIQDGEFAEYDEITYEWALNGDILSVWLYRHYMPWEYSEWNVYNISVSEKREISKQELLDIYGISEATYQEKARQAMGSYYLDYARWYYDQAGADDLFLRQFNKTVAESNISEAVPFVNQDGDLCVVAYVYSLAGGESYLNIINLTTFTISPLYESYVEEGL